ncbi:hypothetical protein ODW21_25555, partial [Escherichia coli]|nr:hypothetical protein [Escherichia coli]
SGEKRVFLVILFTSFSGSLVSRISGAVQTVSPFVHSTHSPPVLAYFMCRHNGALPEFVKESVVHITLCLSPFSGDSSG